MKKPKALKRHCPKCNKHTEHKVSESKSRGRNAAHPMSRFSTSRLKSRGLRSGVGNLGRFSKPPIKKWKSTGKKISKKSDLRYQCLACKKSSVQKKGVRAKKLELV